MRHPAAIAVLLALTACGPKPPDDNDAGEQPVEDAGENVPDAGRPRRDAGVTDAGWASVAITDWCADEAWARCTRNVRCLMRSQATFDDCVAEELKLCDQPAFTSAVTNGRMAYDPAQAASCLNAYGRGSCIDEPSECASVFTGSQTANEGCLLPEECAQGSFCYLYSNTCPFTCHAYVPLGGSCNFGDQQCDQSGYCDSADGGFQYTCLPRVAAGAACSTWSQCPANYGCLNGSCIKQRAELGEPCAQASGYPLCNDDAFCRREAGNNPPPGVCTKRVGLGGTCTGYGVCEPGLRCSTSFTVGVCQPLGGPGEVCAGYYDCQDGLYCDNDTSRCTALPGDGGDCGSQGSFYRCALGNYCDFNTDVCIAQRGVGSACTYDDVCASANCEYGTLPDGGFGGRCVEACSVRLDGGV